MVQYNKVAPQKRQGGVEDGQPGSLALTEGTLLRDVHGQTRHVRMVIVGSGFGGLCMAIKLKQAGIHDFVVLERSHTVGGTWRDNTYPGCECDVPSHLYSFSFAPGDWPRPFASHRDIQAYIQGVTDDYALRPHVQFGANMQAAVFDETANVWRIETNLGPIVADTVASASGGLANPMIPELPGLETFQGESFHSARWNHDYDMQGKRVAVIGTGASTIQFLPRIAPKAAHLTLFQRTPAWVMPKPNRPFSKGRRWALRHLPLYRRLYRASIFLTLELFGLMLRWPKSMAGARREGRRHIARHIKDPALRELLTPDYVPGCKRILLNNAYYPALARDNVAVTGSGIKEIRPHSVITEDGQEHPVDVIVFGTGFHVQGSRGRPKFVGRAGRSLADHADGDNEAYKGTLIEGFPNLFMLGGPNSGLGHNSIIFMLEGAVRQTMQALRLMERRGAAVIEVKKAAQDAYNEAVQAKLAGSVWTTGCSSYYTNDRGRITAIWPGSAASYKLATWSLSEDHVELTLRGSD